MKRKHGFTIVELVIVIAVIAILAAVLIPTFSSVIQRAYDSADLQNRRNNKLKQTIAQILGEDIEGDNSGGTGGSPTPSPNWDLGGQTLQIDSKGLEISESLIEDSEANELIIKNGTMEMDEASALIINYSGEITIENVEFKANTYGQNKSRYKENTGLIIRDVDSSDEPNTVTIKNCSFSNAGLWFEGNEESGSSDFQVEIRNCTFTVSEFETGNYGALNLNENCLGAFKHFSDSYNINATKGSCYAIYSEYESKDNGNATVQFNDSLVADSVHCTGDAHEFHRVHSHTFLYEDKGGAKPEHTSAYYK